MQPDFPTAPPLVSDTGSDPRRTRRRSPLHTKRRGSETRQINSDTGSTTVPSYDCHRSYELEHYDFLQSTPVCVLAYFEIQYKGKNVLSSSSSSTPQRRNGRGGEK